MMNDLDNENIFFNTLLEGMRNKDMLALKEFYTKYGNKIGFVAFSYMGKYDEAEEIINDILVKVWNFAQKGEYVHKPNAWLFTVIKNHCLTQLRKKKKNIKIGDLSNIEDNFKEKESEIHFYDYLLPLNDKERKVVTLKLVFMYTFKEIGKELKITQSRASKIYYRAKEKLENLLKNEE